MRACLRRNQPRPYQIPAAINAFHADADSFEATDWSQILALYDQLLAMTPTPVVAMNRAIALAEVDGPAPALGTSSARSAFLAPPIRRCGRTSSGRPVTTSSRSRSPPAS